MGERQGMLEPPTAPATPVVGILGPPVVLTGETGGRRPMVGPTAKGETGFPPMVNCTGGGGVVAPELLLLVLRLCPSGGVPMVYCVCGGDSWQMSGTAEGGAEVRRDLAWSCCWWCLGDLGLEAGLESEEALGLLEAEGLGCTAAAPNGATPSSGRGPRVDPPLAELTPDMAETESPLLVLDRVRLCCSCW